MAVVYRKRMKNLRSKCRFNEANHSHLDMPRSGSGRVAQDRWKVEQERGKCATVATGMVDVFLYSLSTHLCVGNGVTCELGRRRGSADCPIRNQSLSDRS